MIGQRFGGFKKHGTAEPSAFWVAIDDDANDGYMTCVGDFNRSLGLPYTFVAKALVARGADSIDLKFESSPFLEESFKKTIIEPLPADFILTARLERDGHGDGFKGDWQLNSVTGEIYLTPRLGSHAHGTPTAPTMTINTWSQYKEWAGKVAHEGTSLFRGQSKPHPLKTSFHRTGRVDLIRYFNIALPRFRDHYSTAVNRAYRHDDPHDVGAIIGIAQHHGFPTPLLDWTESPYIAAYFAFAEALGAPDDERSVRIFRLTPSFLQSDAKPEGIMEVSDPRLKVAVFKPESRGNLRLLNQQGAFTFSNVLDIEWWMRDQESRTGNTYLQIIDLPAKLAREAVTDLRYMGTSAAGLFPGIDGIATQLKHQLFFS
ncbi:FRG domain protein [mine drainage metagenome]|uniref:FRG domain protein n=1 Tax=mine drainage metagenome TaxID=410659 RepID=A0A1J5R4V9_9ZZZZ